MKKIFFIAILFIGLFSQLNAQDKVYERRGSGIYFELLGNGIAYSVNYESRLSNKNRGLGARIGIAYYNVEEEPTVIAPVMLNYLLGKPEGKHFLELGGGFTLSNRSGQSVNVNEEEIFFKNKINGTFSVMYHYHPPYGGFLFKIGFTPFLGQFDNGSNFLSWVGICFGYAF